MMKVPYLQNLVVRLATGVGNWPESDIRKMANYFLAAQHSDGGFGGREGGSDLYYSAFAIRSLAVLGELHGETAERSAAYLRSQLDQTVPLVDLLSFLFAGFQVEAASGARVFATLPEGWEQNVLQMLEQLRRPDGGYAKSVQTKLGSTYQTFLVLLAYELFQKPFPDPQRTIDFLKSQQSDDGAFREVKVGKRSSTNPTAAAVASLLMLEALDEETAQATVDFLCDMQTLEGGLRANTRIPVADLLSTFTGLLTMIDLDAVQELNLRSIQQYAQQLKVDSGGFRGALLDPGHDVEYSFYGLGTGALLTAWTGPL